MTKDILMKNDEKAPTSNENACNQLQQFCLLAKTIHGAPLSEIIKQVLEVPNIYVFGELLVMPNVQELNKGEHIKYFNTLNLFAYGTYKQYRQKPNDYIELTPVMQKKLQHLTIVSLAIQNKCIPYEVLMEELEINSIRSLEDTIIEVMYADIIHGKLFQNKRYLEVDYAQGRDVPLGYITKIGQTLQEWTDSSDAILSCIQKEIAGANDVKLQHITREKDIEQQITNIKKLFKNQQCDSDDLMQIDSRKSVCSNSDIRKKSSKTIRPSDFFKFTSK